MPGNILSSNVFIDKSTHEIEKDITNPPIESEEIELVVRKGSKSPDILTFMSRNESIDGINNNVPIALMNEDDDVTFIEDNYKEKKSIKNKSENSLDLTRGHKPSVYHVVPVYKENERRLQLANIRGKKEPDSIMISAKERVTPKMYFMNNVIRDEYRAHDDKDSVGFNEKIKKEK